MPNSLLALVAMILNGPTIKEQSDRSSTSTLTLTISQLIKFNIYACRRQSTSIKPITHGYNRETPLHVYLVMLMHPKIRKQDLVDTLFHSGISASYDRVLTAKHNNGLGEQYLPLLPAGGGQFAQLNSRVFYYLLPQFVA